MGKKSRRRKRRRSSHRFYSSRQDRDTEIFELPVNNRAANNGRASTQVGKVAFKKKDAKKVPAHEYDTIAMEVFGSLYYCCSEE